MRQWLPRDILRCLEENRIPDDATSAQIQQAIENGLEWPQNPYTRHKIQREVSPGNYEIRESNDYRYIDFFDASGATASRIYVVDKHNAESGKAEKQPPDSQGTADLVR